GEPVVDGACVGRLLEPRVDGARVENESVARVIAEERARLLRIPPRIVEVVRSHELRIHGLVVGEVHGRQLLGGQGAVDREWHYGGRAASGRRGEVSS